MENVETPQSLDVLRRLGPLTSELLRGVRGCPLILFRGVDKPLFIMHASDIHIFYEVKTIHICMYLLSFNIYIQTL